MKTAPEPAAEARESAPAAPNAKPFVKWAGGKWSLAPEIHRYLPKDLHQRTYREPFLGGGALFFYLRNKNAAARFVLTDQLEDLVGAYAQVRDNTEALVKALRKLKRTHSTERFYEIRDQFNARKGKPVDRAAWLIYLNKTCFNGLFRTNRSGHFNVPVGRFADPAIADEPRLLAAAQALAGVSVSTQSFDHLLDVAEPGDVIYLDPPYVPISRTANFAAYSGGHFGADEQARLAAVYRKLDERGCWLVLSNSDADEVHELYKGFQIERIEARRAISSRTSERKPAVEVLVLNRGRGAR